MFILYILTEEIKMAGEIRPYMVITNLNMLNKLWRGVCIMLICSINQKYVL